MLCSSSYGYPWESDPAITHAWIADLKYMDASVIVGDWAPNKGNIHLSQPTFGAKPSFSAAWGSGSKGMLSFDGVNDHLIGDAMAAIVSGLAAFTMIVSVQALTIANIRDVWSFSDTSDTTSGHSLQLGTEATHPWRNGMQDDTGALRLGVTGFNANTNRVVIVNKFDGVSLWTTTINGVNQTVVHTGPAPGTTTHSKFTVAGFRGATSFANLNCNLRGLWFSKSILSAGSTAAVVNHQLAEAA